MSLAETFVRNRSDRSTESPSRYSWTGEFEEEEPDTAEVEESDDGITIPVPVDSKKLYQAYATSPPSDRLQTNIGRHLHNLRSTDSHYLKTIDAVKPREGEQILSESVKLLSRISSLPPVEILDLLKMFLNLGARDDHAVNSATVGESFEGYVDRIDGDAAYVTLESREFGDVLHGEYSAAILRQKGIDEQTRFLCKTIKVGGSTRIEFEALPDVELTHEEVRAIADKIDRTFPRDDTGVEY